MNTLRKPRKRPRVDSVSFRTFGWLLEREAAYQMLFAPALTRELERSFRSLLCSLPGPTLRKRVGRRLGFRPDRRWC